MNRRRLNRRSFLRWANLAGLAAGLPSLPAFATTAHEAQPEDSSAGKSPSTAKLASPDTILLKDYRPKSIYKIPVTEIARAKFPIIDMHSHPYARTEKEIDAWVATMDEVGINKTIILTMATGADRIRLVLHADVDDDHVAKAIEAFGILASRA